ncbi:MAG: hypothetical protein EP350_03420 [Alphaproteobacteria bacterium]|nr:MAG: hypothetical protein EP350_03420 [Alphaproteobacteria bacterium]
MKHSAPTTLRDSFFSLMGGVGPLAIALITIPLLIGHIGAARFGALTIVWLLLGYFGQADFGIGRAVTQRIAAMTGNQHTARAQTICTALVANSAIGIALGVLAGIAAYLFFTGPFDVSAELRAELIDTVWLVGATIPVVTIFGVAHGSLIGSQNFGTAALATFIGNSLMQLFPLGVAALGSNHMSALIAASLAGRAFGLTLALGGMWRHLLKDQPWQASTSEAAELFRFGKWVMLSAVIGPFMILSDRFLIGTFLGAVAVAAYAVPYQVGSRTQVFPQALLTVMFPRFASDNAGQANASANQVAAAIAILYAVPIVILICLAEPLLDLWIGANLDPRSILVARILLAGFWVNALAQVPFNLLQARGSPRSVALLHLAELPFYISLLLLLGGAFGLPGFAAAFAIRCAVDCGLLFARSGLPLGGLWPQLWLPVGAIALAAGLHPLLFGWKASLLAACTLGGIMALRSLTMIPYELLRFGRRKEGGDAA